MSSAVGSKNNHTEWVELFDRKADPYETKNLINDRKRAEIKSKLEKEYDRLAKELDYKVPADGPAKLKRKSEALPCDSL